MPSLDDAGLDDVQRARIAAALDVDPVLAEELELIEGSLESGSRRRFWRALARECGRRDRPAAAVLAALEYAALREQD